MKYITVDSGTTNTRLYLVSDGAIVDDLKFHAGISVGRDELKKMLCSAIRKMLQRNSITELDIARILASGMITSEFGLVDLPHLVAPAGISELHNSMYETKLAEITSIPFVFIRGIRCISNSLDRTDMMRGEETETIGLLSRYKADTVVLPGSHSKIVDVDENGSITSFSTMLTGEMITALSKNTILSHSVKLLTGYPDEDYLKSGYDYCDRHGINNALFKARVLDKQFHADQLQCYSFFMGVVLHDEVCEILSRRSRSIAIGGNNDIKRIMAVLLKLPGQKVMVIPDEFAMAANSVGMINIFEYTA